MTIIKGKWVFNEILNLQTKAESLETGVSVNFSSAGVNFDKMKTDSNDFFYSNDEEIYSVYNGNAWSRETETEAYRTIDFGETEQIIDDDFYVWFIANASPTITTDTSWYDNTKTEFVITTAAQLNGLADLSKTNNFAGKIIKLGADISFNVGISGTSDMETKATQVWNPLGTAAVPFGGHIDGQGYTISGLYNHTNGTVSQGLIGYGDNITVKNLRIERSYFRGNNNSNVGAVVGTVTNGAKIYNVYTDAYLR